jgi:hypothetical protein
VMACVEQTEGPILSNVTLAVSPIRLLSEVVFSTITTSFRWPFPTIEHHGGVSWTISNAVFSGLVSHKT